ncbi:Synaptic vesicular amine transporter [Halotydeus destructor]|nr:Synaptic vesicular amine transporter [Halotydeus destructor]
MSENTEERKFEERLVDLLRACRGSKRLLILVVAIALLLDNVLVTSVGPLKDIKRRALEKRHGLISENFEIGVLFASKSVLQGITNLFIVGWLTSSIGYSIPMFTGFIIMFIATLTFAIGESMAVLLIARGLQGIGSSLTSVSGMGMLAERFPDDKERGSAMALALSGLALGVLIGPPFGGIVYETLGKAAPFIMLAFLALLDGILQLFVLQPKVVRCAHEATSLRDLASDPCIQVAAGALTVANAAIAVLEPSLPLHMIQTMDADNWQQGAVFLPASMSYLMGTSVFGHLSYQLGRWKVAMLGTLAIGFALLCIPWANSVNDLILPNAVIGLGMGMVDSTMMPTLAYLVDIRHNSVYGTVYALGDIAFCVSFVLGPLLSATVGSIVGFSGLIVMTSLMCFIFAPFLLLLRQPAIMREEQSLHHASVKYGRYGDSS